MSQNVFIRDTCAAATAFSAAVAIPHDGKYYEVEKQF